MILDSLTQAVGNTPMVRLRSLEPPGVEIHAKLEWFNPGGSVKDRAALRMVQEAVSILRGRTLLDSTSGNTGIAYAWIGAALHIPVALVMPGNVSEARKRIARHFGARIIFSDALEQSDGAIRLARKLVEARPDDANSQLLLGIAEFKTGDAEGAKRDLQRCLMIDPHLADAHYYLALMARRAGNIDAARAELEEVVRTNPEHASAEAELGTLYLQTGNLEQARTVLEKAVQLAPTVPQYHYHLSLAYSRLGLQEAARTEMKTYNRFRQTEDEEHKRKDAASPPPAAASQP